MDGNVLRYILEQFSKAYIVLSIPKLLFLPSLWVLPHNRDPNLPLNCHNNLNIDSSVVRIDSNKVKFPDGEARVK